MSESLKYLEVVRSEGPEELMQELRQRALKANLPFKVKGYEKAIRSIASHPRPIANADEIRELPGVGKKTAEKIQEIIETVESC